MEVNKIAPGITVVGIGLGTPEYLLPVAKSAVERAEILVGGSRALSLFAYLNKPHLVIDSHLDELISKIKVEAASKHIVILVSGDPGFYSLLPKLQQHISADKLHVIPGISSFQLVFARCGLAWQESAWISVHGRSFPEASRWLKYLREKEWLACLTDPQNTPQKIAAFLSKLGEGARDCIVAENAGYSHERIQRLTLIELSEEDKNQGKLYQPAVLLIQGDGMEVKQTDAQEQMIKEIDSSKPFLSGIPDERFQRGSLPMTKAEVRALVMSRAAIRAGDIVWDIGAGTGSISVEAALHANQGIVYAVDREAESEVLIAANAKIFGLNNIVFVQGRAPEALEKLPAPNRVIVGGGGKSIVDVLEAVWKRIAPGGTIVVTAVTIDTTYQCLKWLDQQDVEIQASQIGVNRLHKRGGLFMWQGLNPVTVISATKGGN